MQKIKNFFKYLLIPYYYIKILLKRNKLHYNEMTITIKSHFQGTYGITPDMSLEDFIIKCFYKLVEQREWKENKHYKIYCGARTTITLREDFVEDFVEGFYDLYERYTNKQIKKGNYMEIKDILENITKNQNIEMPVKIEELARKLYLENTEKEKLFWSKNHLILLDQEKDILKVYIKKGCIKKCSMTILKLLKHQYISHMKKNKKTKEEIA